MRFFPFKKACFIVSNDPNSILKFKIKSPFFACVSKNRTKKKQVTSEMQIRCHVIRDPQLNIKSSSMIPKSAPVRIPGRGRQSQTHRYKVNARRPLEKRRREPMAKHAGFRQDSGAALNIF